MTALTPSLLRETVLARLMPPDAIEHADAGVSLSSALRAMAHLTVAGAEETAHSRRPSAYGDSLVYALVGSLLTSLNARQQDADAARADRLQDVEVTEPEKPVARVALSPWQERRAKELMSSQMDKGLSIARIAADCSLSRSHFSRAFKKNTGLSPRDWFLQMRLDKAKGLLADSALSISQISLDCGFADQSHFTRVFTRVVGTTPFSWRRAMSSVRPQRCAAESLRAG